MLEQERELFENTLFNDRAHNMCPSLNILCREEQVLFVVDREGARSGVRKAEWK